jgi:hypothetical protein
MVEMHAFYTVLVYEMRGVNFSLKSCESLEAIWICDYKILPRLQNISGFATGDWECEVTLCNQSSKSNQFTKLWRPGFQFQPN